MIHFTHSPFNCPPYLMGILGSKRNFADFSASHNKVSELQPGLILIKQSLSLSEQIELTKNALERGEDPEKGFWKLDQHGQRVLNQAPSAPHRGRIFDALKNFPPLITELCLKNLTLAFHTAPSIKLVEPTHLILLYYKTLVEPPKGGYIPWHQDKDPNDGDEDKPVVSITLGDSCDFQICNDKPELSLAHPLNNPKNLKHRIVLESGDVLIFGGPSRKIHHSIFKMHRDTAPKSLPLQNARLNLTFRFAPKILGEEEKFSSENFKSVYHK